MSCWNSARSIVPASSSSSSSARKIISSASSSVIWRKATRSEASNSSLCTSLSFVLSDSVLSQPLCNTAPENKLDSCFVTEGRLFGPVPLWVPECALSSPSDSLSRRETVSALAVNKLDILLVIVGRFFGLVPLVALWLITKSRLIIVALPLYSKKALSRSWLWASSFFIIPIPAMNSSKSTSPSCLGAKNHVRNSEGASAWNRCHAYLRRHRHQQRPILHGYLDALRRSQGC